MPRWRQTKEIDPKTGRSKFVPVDDAARAEDGHFIHGDLEPFVSPIDGSVISDRKQYDEHCKKHGVVPAAEFDEAHYRRAAEKRADHYLGRRSKQEIQHRREQLNEIINMHERSG